MITLEFEKEVVEKKQKLLAMMAEKNPPLTKIKALEKKIQLEEVEIYSNLNPWQITLMARHPERPGTLEFISSEVDEFVELAGDRMFGNDLAIVGGIGKIGATSFMIIGQAKGTSTVTNVRHNFGMPHPEGYRKALRLMHLANRFNLPIVTLIDTPGAYPGIDAEERQQSIAIAECLQAMGTFTVPVISIVMGEGGSGGALAISVANRMLMLTNSIFSVISAEGCSSILWGDASKKQHAAEILKYTAKDLIELKIIDAIIPEPISGAHNNKDLTLRAVSKAILANYNQLKKLSADELRSSREKKYRNIGVFQEK